MIFGLKMTCIKVLRKFYQQKSKGNKTREELFENVVYHIENPRNTR